MLVSHEREKMINAVIYFAKNTRFMGKIKLWKLLIFLFRAFQGYGNLLRHGHGLFCLEDGAGSG